MTPESRRQMVQQAIDYLRAGHNATQTAAYVGRSSAWMSQ